MRIVIGITVLLGVALTSCNKPPEACIAVDNSSISVGSNVTFSAACSKHALSYIWTFEGPDSSSMNDIQRSEEVITVAFDEVGSYTVTLEAYEKYSWLGQMSTATTEVTVN